jgi:hypothetical protein
MKRTLIMGASPVVLARVGPLTVMGEQMGPKTMGQMIELRREPLKAIGEAMIKHAKAMSKEPER